MKFLVAIVLSLTFQSAVFGYSGGQGTPDDPFQIATKADLTQLASNTSDYNKHFTLTADITLTGSSYSTALIAKDTSTSTGFQGTKFTGVFNGQNHTISALYISEGAAHNSYMGLFGVIGVSGIVCNVVLLGTVYATDYTGLLAGYNEGMIFNCRTNCTLLGNSYVGGLVGYNDGIIVHCSTEGSVNGGGILYRYHGGFAGINYSRIFNSYSLATVTSSGDYVGGFTSHNYGTIVNCFAVGDVLGDTSYASYVGGFIGYQTGQGYIANCYSKGKVTGTSSRGGFAAFDIGSVVNCFWDVNTSTLNTSAAGTGRTTAQMQTASTYTGAGWDWDNETVNGSSDTWMILPAGGYPQLCYFQNHLPAVLTGSGTAQSPYLVSNAAQLGAVNYYDPFAHYKLAGYIDLSGISWRCSPVIILCGVFDGDSYDISNLNLSTGGYGGLFSCIYSRAVLRNLDAQDFYVHGNKRCVGALAGFNYGTIERCASFSCDVHGDGTVGGLVGGNFGTLDYAYATGLVTGTDYIGGLVGTNQTSLIQNSKSACIVKGTRHVGGIAGANFSQAIIRRSGSDAYVVGYTYADFVGGLVGSNGYYESPQSQPGGMIESCFSVADVNCNAHSTYIGGFAGYNYEPGTITNCSSSGSVKTASDCGYVGGFIGKNEKYISKSFAAAALITTADNYSIGGFAGTGTPSLITDSFWDTAVSGTTTSAGAVWKTTAEMKNFDTYSNAHWDFAGEGENGIADSWAFLPAEYPRHAWDTTAIVLNKYSYSAELPVASAVFDVNFVVSNSGTGTASWVAECNAVDSWIVSVTPASGTSQGSWDSSVVRIVIDPCSLASGLHTGKVTVSDADGVLRDISFDISLLVYDYIGVREFASLASCWGKTDLDITQPCSRVDWFIDGRIDINDLAQFAAGWLQRDITTYKPFREVFEDFSAGLPVSNWTFYSSNETGNITVVDQKLRMDSDYTAYYTLNEAILHLDLKDQVGSKLSFWQAEYYDELHTLAASFSNHSNGDGVAVSSDGINWETIFSATQLDVGLTGQTFTYNLDDAGLEYTSDFQIKFQQYDNGPWGNEGREFDNIRVYME